MIKVAYPGSFNPWHNGHQYVYSQLCEMFGTDNVYVIVAVNASKGTTSTELVERGLIIHGAIRNVSRILTTTDTIAEVCERHGISYIARGIRSGHDATSEFTMADWNLDMGMHTLFVYCGAGLRKLSSSAIRELHSHGVNVRRYMPSTSYERWIEYLSRQRK